MNSAQQATTTFAGETAPDHSERDKKITGAVIGLAFLVAFPLAVLTAVGTWATFAWGRIHHSVLLAVLGVYTAVIALTGHAPAAFWEPLASWKLLFGLIDNTGEWKHVLLQALWMQAPLSVFAGLLIGIGVAWWSWFRRPSWETFTFRLTPWQWLKRRKNIHDIQSDKHSPDNGKTVGVESTTGKKIIQTDAEARAHTLCVGSTGSGKTTTLMLMARDIIKRGQGLIFVDLKGSPDVADTLQEYAERYGRDFQHWIMQTPGQPYNGPDPKGPAYYDPLNRGDASRRTNLVMAGREWTEPYYETLAQDYLQRAFEVAIQNPPVGSESSFSDLASLFDPLELRARARTLDPGNRRHAEILRQIDEYFNADGSVKKDNGTQSALKSVEAELRILTNSTAGAWLRKDPDGDNDINLRSVADKGSIVVFSLDSNNYESDASRIGNLIIQDLKTVTSELMSKPAENILQVYIDEFSAIDSENIVGLINKSRAANVPVTLSTQAIDDLRRSSEAFMGRVVANINSFIIHRANDYDDAEEYSKLTGKVKKQQFNQQVEHSTSLFGRMGKGAGTGHGNLVEVEDYRVSPSQIQELGTGEAVYIAKSPLRFEFVTVIPEVAGQISSTPQPDTAPKPKVLKADEGTVTTRNAPEKRTDDAAGMDTPKPAVDTVETSADVRKADPEVLQRIFNKENRVRTSGIADIAKPRPTLPRTEQAPTISKTVAAGIRPPSSVATPPATVAPRQVPERPSRSMPTKPVRPII